MWVIADGAGRFSPLPRIFKGAPETGHLLVQMHQTNRDDRSVGFGGLVEGGQVPHHEGAAGPNGSRSASPGTGGVF